MRKRRRGFVSGTREGEPSERAIEQRGAALLWPEGRNSPTLGSLPSIPEERVEGRKHALKGGMEGWRAGAHIRRKDSGKSIQTVTIIHLHMTEPVTNVLGVLGQMKGQSALKCNQGTISG